MLKKLAKLSLIFATLSLGGEQAQAVLEVTVPEVSFTANGFGVIEVITTDGQTWSQIKKSDLFFPVSISASISSGYLRGHLVRLGNQHIAHELYAPDKPTSFQKSMILKGVTTDYSAVFQDQIIAQCNERLSSGNGINETHALTYDANLSLTVWSGYGNEGGYYTPVVIDKSIPISLRCLGKPKAGPYAGSNDIGIDPGPFKIKDIDLFLTTFSGANTQPNPASICKKAQVKVRLKTTKAGPTKFKLWTKVGGVMTSKVVDAWASHDGNGGFKSEHTEWVSVNKPTYVQAKAEEMISGFGSSTPWKDITLHCTNPGGGGLATNPNTSNPDNDIPQGKNVEADFSFVDYGSPKCTRTGKALVTLQSPKADNVHLSLDCKEKSHSAVVPVAPNPAGGYSAVKLISFDIDKTIDESCTLRTVAPYGPKDHVTKQHLFQCVTPSGHSASNDVQVPSNPPSDKPDFPATLVPTAPHKVIVGAGTSQAPVSPWECQGGTMRGHNGCVCPPHKKLFFGPVEYHGKIHNGSKCVEKDLKPWPAGQSPDPQDKAKADALKLRLEAAKKAADAKRKREEAAKAAAALAQRKAAAALAQRKAAAALAKRKAAAALAQRKAAAALAQRKAAAALAQRKAAAALAQRKAAVALAQRNAAAALARRKATLKKRAAPSSVGNATQMRVIRRR